MDMQNPSDGTALTSTYGSQILRIFKAYISIKRTTRTTTVGVGKALKRLIFAAAIFDPKRRF